MLKLSGKMRSCKRCGFTTNEEWFYPRRKIVHSTMYENRRTICPWCLQNERDAEKKRNRFKVKTRNMIYSAVRKYNKQSDKRLTVHEFIKTFRWPTVEILANQIEHEWTNTCHLCHERYDAKPELGLGNLTLEHIYRFPETEPFWQLMRFCCRSSNVAKGKRDPEWYDWHLTKMKEAEEWVKTKPPNLRGRQFEMAELLK